MYQKYTSANTSINKEPPKIYTLIGGTIKDTETVIDYGCGKFFDDYHLGDNFFPYDPYNRSDEENADIRHTTYDIAICSNVLNVIMEKEVREYILRDLKRLAKKVFITVYDGPDKDNIGRVTKPDCYQLNRKPKEYLQEIADVFGLDNVKWSKGYYTCIVIR